jgi:hypothetical protein
LTVFLHVLLLGDLGDAVVEHFLLGGSCSCGTMVRRLDRALTDADAAAHAVQRGDGHGELVDALALAGLDVRDLGGGGSGLGLFLGQRERTDGGVRADIRAVVALDALGGIPGRGRTATPRFS